MNARIIDCKEEKDDAEEPIRGLDKTNVWNWLVRVPTIRCIDDFSKSVEDGLEDKKPGKGFDIVTIG